MYYIYYTHTYIYNNPRLQLLQMWQLTKAIAKVKPKHWTKSVMK